MSDEQHARDLLRRIEQEANKTAQRLGIPETVGYDALAVLHDQTGLGEETMSTEFTRDFGPNDEYQLETNSDGDVFIIHFPNNEYKSFDSGEALTILDFLHKYQGRFVKNLIMKQAGPMPAPHPVIEENES